MKKRHISLIGPRCSGKSTLGKLLADELGWQFIDIDDALMKEAKAKSMIEMIKGKGKQWMVQSEHGLLKKHLGSEKYIVIATGGRTISHEYPEIKAQNKKLLNEKSICIFPQVSEDLLWESIKKDQYKQHRHLDEKKLRKNFEESLAYLNVFIDAADVLINRDNQTPKQTVKSILSELEKLGI